MIVLTDGGGPNAGQRRELVDTVRGRKYLTAAFTYSFAVRTVINAFNRIEVKAFHPTRVMDGLALLRLSRMSANALWPSCASSTTITLSSKFASMDHFLPQ